MPRSSPSPPLVIPWSACFRCAPMPARRGPHPFTAGAHPFTAGYIVLSSEPQSRLRTWASHAAHGTSVHGETSKKPSGFRWKPTRSQGITGASSSLTMWVTPNTCHTTCTAGQRGLAWRGVAVQWLRGALACSGGASTTSLSSMRSSRSVHAGRPSGLPVHSSARQRT